MSRVTRSAGFIRRAHRGAPPGTDPRSGLSRIAVQKGEGHAWLLLLTFVREGGEGPVIPPAITPDNIRITSVKGIAAADFVVTAVDYPPSGDTLTVVLDDRRPREVILREGDAPPYTLILVDVAGLDPAMDRAAFLLMVGGPREVDCLPSPDIATPPLPEPPDINYLARDYQSLRTLMLDELAVWMPEWRGNNPADWLVAVTEVLAYAGDQLGYYQDAVATEAYLETARRRVSVRRHARFVDYMLHEGCNARAWVVLGTDATEFIPRGTKLLTRVPGLPNPATLSPDDHAGFHRALAQGAKVFETMTGIDVNPANNELLFATPGQNTPCMLARGATSAKLTGDITTIAPGDVLIFEEVLGAATGLAEDADPTRRHAVRLLAVTPVDYVTPVAPVTPAGDGGSDPAPQPTATLIAWSPGDALPFPLWITSVVDGRRIDNITVARGNAVLADHGHSLADQPLEPAQAPFDGRYQPHLTTNDLTHREPLKTETPIELSATQAIRQDPRQASPAITLRQLTSGDRWTARGDLLSSGPFARDFIVEVESNRQAFLRFGDGVLGRRPAPGTTFTADYRTGNGTSGNVGAEAIGRAVTGVALKSVRNPMPAAGGVNPEAIEHARLYAPQAFRTQERAVTAADYKRLAERHPDVQAAAATADTSGASALFHVAIDRFGGKPVDAVFQHEMTAFLEPFRIAGTRFEVIAPILVPVDVVLVAYVKPGFAPGAVRAALSKCFSDGMLPDGRPAFFNPDNFTFGQPVYLSRIITAALTVAGVAWVNSDPSSDPRIRFHRSGQAQGDEIAAGEIPIGPLEIACAASNPAKPENGKVEFYVVVDR
jgi:hypothetical protein